MPGQTLPADDEKRSYGALWLLCSLLLLVGALWAIADDNVFRRPWEKYQAGFNRLEISKLEEALRAEQARLDADTRDQAGDQALADARRDVAPGDAGSEVGERPRPRRE